ncbi:MAG: cytochrome c, partial [Afipia sp.]|nr:cytochrome c [Afipia sp.]
MSSLASLRPAMFAVALLAVNAVPASVMAAETHQRFGYGTPATPEQIKGWDIDARAEDGKGLPPGKGDVNHGAEVFADQCA